MKSQHFEILERDQLAAMATPFRQALLESLELPNSATGLAHRFDMSRQRVGYHMRELEKAGCIGVIGERPQRGLIEKLYQVRPRVFALGPAAPAPMAEDQFSYRTLLNLLGAAVLSLIGLRRRADASGKRLATLALEAELHFASPGERKAFTEDLLDAVQAVVRRHESPQTNRTRSFRLLVGAFPGAPVQAPKTTTGEAS